MDGVNKSTMKPQKYLSTSKDGHSLKLSKEIKKEIKNKMDLANYDTVGTGEDDVRNRSRNTLLEIKNTFDALSFAMPSEQRKSPLFQELQKQSTSINNSLIKADKLQAKLTEKLQKKQENAAKSKGGSKEKSSSGTSKGNQGTKNPNDWKVTTFQNSENMAKNLSNLPNNDGDNDSLYSRDTVSSDTFGDSDSFDTGNQYTSNSTYAEIQHGNSNTNNSETSRLDGEGFPTDLRNNGAKDEKKSVYADLEISTLPPGTRTTEHPDGIPTSRNSSSKRTSELDGFEEDSNQDFENAIPYHLRESPYSDVTTGQALNFGTYAPSNYAIVTPGEDKAANAAKSPDNVSVGSSDGYGFSDNTSLSESFRGFGDEDLIASQLIGERPGGNTPLDNALITALNDKYPDIISGAKHQDLNKNDAELELGEYTITFSSKGGLKLSSKITSQGKVGIDRQTLKIEKGKLYAVSKRGNLTIKTPIDDQITSIKRHTENASGGIEL